MGNSVSSIGNVGGQLFKQYGLEPMVGGNTRSNYGLYGQPKPTGNYASQSGYQNMMQRLYGNPSLTGQYQTTKSAAQPSSVANPFAMYRSMNMMPYWMALTRRFMNGR